MNKNSELLKGLSIEELEERNEFTALATEVPVDTEPLKCVICRC